MGLYRCLTRHTIHTKTYKRSFWFVGFCCGLVMVNLPITLRANSSLHWRHNDHDGVSNHQPHDCLLNRLFGRRLKKTSKLRVTGLCAGNSTGPVNSPHKGPVTRKMFPFDDVIMIGTDSASEVTGRIWVYTSHESMKNNNITTTSKVVIYSMGYAVHICTWLVVVVVNCITPLAHCMCRIHLWYKMHQLKVSINHCMLSSADPAYN